jgi:hypothetical protein
MTTKTMLSVPHVVRGRLVDAASVEYEGADGEPFATPRLDADDLIWPRSEPLPAAETPVAEIIDVLVAAGELLKEDQGGFLTAALDLLVRTSPYERRILEHSYEGLWRAFTADRLRALLEGELGGADVVDGWRPATGPEGRHGWVRAYPTRLIRVLAGNSPGVAAVSIARGALMKGVHLLKMPSNDLLTATAILRALQTTAPRHPTTASFSAVYWRGGDGSIEDVLFRPQFFDKVIAWGGEAAIRNVVRYLGPGFELVAFDPKNSISMIGREAFATALEEVASLGAADATLLNQEACSASRYQFVEGELADVDRYCELLRAEMEKERPLASAVVPPPPRDVREEIEALRFMEPAYRVFGHPDGRGLVIRSEEPVGFFPSGKTVNVVAVPDLRDAVRYITVATQTVSVFPQERKPELRDALASSGVQRVVPLGASHGMIPGFPHDGFLPMHRFVRWVNDEC